MPTLFLSPAHSAMAGRPTAEHSSGTGYERQTRRRCSALGSPCSESGTDRSANSALTQGRWTSDWVRSARTDCSTASNAKSATSTSWVLDRAGRRLVRRRRSGEVRKAECLRRRRGPVRTILPFQPRRRLADHEQKADADVGGQGKSGSSDSTSPITASATTSAMRWACTRPTAPRPSRTGWPQPERAVTKSSLSTASSAPGGKR